MECRYSPTSSHPLLFPLLSGAGENGIEPASATEAQAFIPKNNFTQPPDHATCLTDRQIVPCQVQNFESPEAYEEKAIVNMQYFLANNVCQQSFDELSSEPTVSVWLSPEQARIIKQSEEGKRLLMLINDIDQLATICSGRMSRRTKQKFEKDEQLPFEFSSDINTLLENIRRYFKRMIIDVAGTSPYCSGRKLPFRTEHLPLTKSDIIDHERLLVKSISVIIRNEQEQLLIPDSLLMDFKRAVGFCQGFGSLLNLMPKAFEDWVDMQSALHEAIIDKISQVDTQAIVGANRFLWSFCDLGVVSKELVNENQTKILDYIASFLIPSRVLPLLFLKPVTDAVPDKSGNAQKSHKRSYSDSYNTDLPSEKAAKNESFIFSENSAPVTDLSEPALSAPPKRSPGILYRNEPATLFPKKYEYGFIDLW